MRTALRVVAIFLLTSAAVPIAVLGTVLGALLFLPLPAKLPEAKAGLESQITRILDADGNPIGVFRKFETSVPFSPDDVPDVLKQAVIASEDKDFYRHGGVDVRGTLRAFWADYRNRSLVQGGSTITQQYVKNAYVGTERTVWRKIREAILASQLDRQFDKDTILHRYLSTIFLGNGAYGVEAASELYFRKTVKELNVSEAAMLAGLIPAPSRYEPLGNPTLAEEKRRIVLRNMLDEGYLTEEAHRDALSRGLWFADSRAPAPPNATLVYKPLQAPSPFPYFRNYVEEYLKDRYGDRLYTGGLTIQTTLDVGMQRAAEEQVRRSLDGTQDPLEMALVAVEPPTGYVRALVGGRDFSASQVNLALGGCPPKPPADVLATVEVEATCWSEPMVEGGGRGKQPGSAFKPFTLAAALAEGIPPTKVYPAPRSYLPKACRGRESAACKPIGNNEGGGGGSTDLRRGTWASINTVYAQLIEDVGVADTAKVAKALGVETAWYSPRVHGISYTLGVLDVSPLEMASAYGVFANGGRRAAPTPVLRITDSRGRIIEDNSKPAGKQVIDAAVADNVTDILKGVITSGTATRADIGRPAAGKTGTAQNYTNAWFVGYTPTLSTAVWMGYRDTSARPLVNIKGNRRVFGGTIPAATWKAFMDDALRAVPVTDFNEPAPIRTLEDDAKRRARGGIDPGARRGAAETPASCDGPCVVAPPPPVAPRPTSPTTSTTTPFDDGGFDDDDGGFFPAADP